MSVEGQLQLDEKRREQEHARAAIGGKLAREVECMTSVLLLEQRDDDHAMAAGEATGCSSEATTGRAERMSRAKPAERRHLPTVGRGESGRSQNRALATQDVLKTASRADSQRLAQSEGSVGVRGRARSCGAAGTRRRGGSGTRFRSEGPTPR